MASEDDDVERQRLSRRTALKGLGAAGAAVAWAAPQISSIPAAAAATVPHPCANGDCGPDGCDDQPDCGTDSQTENPCSCAPNYPDGTGCSCTQNVVCDDLNPCDLQAQEPCPPGFACQVGCCNQPLCFPLCA